MSEQQANTAVDQEQKDQALISEYHERNERKKDDDKWLKANKPKVMTLMGNQAGKKQFGSYQVSVVEPDESKFDPELLKGFLIDKNLHVGTLSVSYLPIEVVTIVDQITERILAGSFPNDQAAVQQQLQEILFGYGSWSVHDESVEPILVGDEELLAECQAKCFVEKKGTPRLTVSKKGRE